MSYSFIYFDVGGVVVLDFSKTNKWNEMLSDLGVKESERRRFDDIFLPEETKFCLGEKSAETFVETMKKEFDTKIPKGYYFLDDFVNRFQPNQTLGKIIVSLKQKYHIGLLTNMYTGMLDRIQKRNLLPKVEWDVIIDSSKIGFVKPSREIFNYATEKAETAPERIFFVENDTKHIEGAKKCGWGTFLYDPANVEESNKDLLSVLS